MRASVHIAIPNLQRNPEVLKYICNEYNLQPRGKTTTPYMIRVGGGGANYKQVSWMQYETETNYRFDLS